MSTETETTATKPAAGTTAEDTRGRKRTLVGRVKSARMQKTVVVEVVRAVRHPIYGKYVRRRKSYKAHDAQGQYREGDVVEIREHAPISREKRWVVVRLVERPEET